MKKVILGATGSIGSSLAKKLVDSGEQVHLVGRDENSLSELAKNLNSTFTVCDVLEENSVSYTHLTLPTTIEV